MTRLVTVNQTFHARVIAARLGAEGILTQLRGNVDGPYPVGEVHVFVAEDDADAARELLLADEVENAFEGDIELETTTSRRNQGSLLLFLVTLMAIVAITVARYL
jgi:hypothetical protein